MVGLQFVNLAVMLPLATMEEPVELQVHNIDFNCCLCSIRRLLNVSKYVHKPETKINLALGNASTYIRHTDIIE